jgi:hypothetical protein
VGVERTAILDDYSSAVRAYNIWMRSNPGREKPQDDDEIETHLESARAELEAFLDGNNFERYLLDSGVRPAQLDRLRCRLLDH